MKQFIDLLFPEGRPSAIKNCHVDNVNMLRFKFDELFCIKRDWGTLE